MIQQDIVAAVSEKTRTKISALCGVQIFLLPIVIYSIFFALRIQGLQPASEGGMGDFLTALFLLILAWHSTQHRDQWARFSEHLIILPRSKHEGAPTLCHRAMSILWVSSCMRCSQVSSRSTIHPPPASLSSTYPSHHRHHAISILNSTKPQNGCC